MDELAIIVLRQCVGGDTSTPLCVRTVAVPVWHMAQFPDAVNIDELNDGSGVCAIRTEVKISKKNSCFIYWVPFQK
ncbi:MAG: hypothetical protein HBSAPP04_26840 [Ignavibacteriaceae bacterium]|nr:MAG: hypothetical protein HBSAPP04_26840 [Ignavibacteriaceae bacterium]